MAAGGMNANTASPNTSGYSGPAPTFGGGPFLSPTGGGTPPSMTPTPPTNPLPATPQPQVQPAMLQQVQPAMRPPYGGPQRGPGSSFEGGMDPFGPRGGYGNLPPDRMPQQDMYGRGRFGFREQQPGGPTWSQQDGIFNYNPNVMLQGMSPLDRMRSRGPDLGMDPRQQMTPRYRTQSGPPQTASQQTIQELPANAPGMRSGPAGLGAINPYAPKG